MNRTWQTDEVRFLLQNYNVLGPTRIAKVLVRSVDAVESKARRLIICPRQPHSFSDCHRSKLSSTVDATFFDVPSSSAFYCAGFLAACGRIIEKPRMILRIRIGAERLDGLRDFLRLIGSKHAVQKSNRHFVVEICNSYLVRSLQDNWRLVPSQACPNPDLPDLSCEKLKAFAVGHLIANGTKSSQVVRWSGTKGIVNKIVLRISELLELPPPRITNEGMHIDAAWTDSAVVQKIRIFLENQKVVDPSVSADVPKMVLELPENC